MRKVLLFIAVMFWFGAHSQQNIALQATAAHSGGGAGIYDASNYNDGIIATGTSTPWGWVSSNGWVEYTWANPVNFQDIVMYHATRKVTGGIIEIWDGNAYVTVVSDLSIYLQPGNEDTISLPVRVNTTKLRFNNLAGTNPNWREIEVYEAPTGLHDAGVESTSSVAAVCPGSYPVSVTVQNYGINRIDSVMVNWSVDGVAQTPVWHTSLLDTIGGTLPSEAIVALGNYSFTAGVNHQLISWTSLPNNAADTTNFNDTLNAIIRLGAPTGLSASNITASSADINWSPLGGTNFRINYGLTGFNPQTGGSVATATGNTAPLTGLTSASVYDAYVVADCGGGVYSDTAGPISFSTLCSGISAVTLPFYENFEGASGTYVGDKVGAYCTNNVQWNFETNVQTDGRLSFDLGYSNTSIGANDTVGASMDEVLNGQPINYLTGTVDMSNYDTSTTSFILLGFFHLDHGDEAHVTDRVWVRGNVTDTWIEVYDLEANGVSGQWVEASEIDITAALRANNQNFSSNFQVRFGQEDNTDITSMSGVDGRTIDDVTIEEVTCLRLQGATFSGITSSQATIHTGTSNTYFQYEWGPCGYTQGSPTAVTGIDSMGTATFTGLAPNTCYDVYLKRDCGVNGISNWSGPYTFRTLCTPFTAPYTDDFDSSPNNVVPYCWNNYITGGRTTNGVAQTYQAGSPNSSPNHIRFYNGSPAGPGDTTLLISPQFSDLTTGDKRVKFMANSTTTLANQLVVGTMASTTDILSFTPLDTIDLVNTYTLYVVNITTANGYNGTDQFVAFRHGNSATFRTIYIDDFVYEQIPPCLPPLANTLGVAGVSSNSANIFWGAGGEGNETHWEVGPVGFTPGTSTHVSADSVAGNIDTTTASGLAPQTTYEFYIRDSCAVDGYSPWVGPFSFTTSCLPVTAPYIETFDGSSWVIGNGSGSQTGTVDLCWTRDPEGNSTWTWNVYNGSPSSVNTGPDADYSGTGNFLYTDASYSSTSGDADIYSPLIDVSSLQVPFVEFYYHRYGTASQMGDMEIAVNDGSGWVTVLTLTGTDQTSGADPWKDKGVDVSSFGDTIQVRFRGKYVSCCSGDMAIDQFEVKEAPSCPDLTGLDTVQVNDVSAILTWQASSKATNGYQIWYGPQGFFQGTGSTGILVNSANDTATIQPLVPQFCYEYVVRSVCAPGDTSDWAGPFVFCTDLGYDAELVDIGRPSGCGSASSEVTAIIKNNGDNSLSGFPISVTLSGTHTNTFSTTYSGTLATGATDTVLMGTINTVNGALITYDGYVGLSNDQITANDSLRFDSVITIPLDPVAYDTTFCNNQDTATLQALPIPGVGYNWYTSSTATTPVFSGNPYRFPIASAQPTYYVEYANNADSLTTTYAGGNSCGGGNMFDITAINNVNISGFGVNTTNTTGMPMNVSVHYIANGTYVGNETMPTAWTLHETVATVSAGSGNRTQVVFANPLVIPSGQTYAIYVEFAASYTNGNGTNQTAVNSDMSIALGVGLCGSFSGVNNPRIFNGTVYYGSVGCSNVRKPVNVTIGNDTAIAAFTATAAGTAGSVNFDANATVNGDHYAWDFGDANTGTGVSTSHTYATSGTYTVTLTVSDSTDCYSTSIADTTLSVTIGLEENALERSMKVYPNPSSGVVNVSFTTENQSAMIRITDVSGKEVMKVENKNINKHFSGTIDIGNLAKGIYMIEINDGNLSAVQRLIKE